MKSFKNEKYGKARGKYHFCDKNCHRKLRYDELLAVSQHLNAPGAYND